MLKAELWGQLIESTGLDGTLTAMPSLPVALEAGWKKLM